MELNKHLSHMHHIAFPVSLEFTPDRNKHTAAIIDTLSDCIPLHGKVRAYIGFSYDDAIRGLIESVKKEFLFSLMANNKTLELKDFKLGFDICEIANNRVWPPGPAGHYYEMQ